MFKKRKLLIFTFSILFVLLFTGFCFAEESIRELEVPLPEIGLDSGITTTPLLPDYVRYIFNFTVVICGFVAFGVLVLGGVRYIASAGNPSTKTDANNQMLSGIMGLVIILGSWLILNTINPELKNISVTYQQPEVTIQEPADVLLCTGNSDEDCKSFQFNQVTLGDLNGKVTRVKLNNTEDFEYGVILHSKENYQGNCVVCLGDSCDISKVNGGYSITVFAKGDGGGEGVTFYEAESQNEKCGPECKSTCAGWGRVCGDNCVGYQYWIFSGMSGGYCWPFKEGNHSVVGLPPDPNHNKVRSLSIDGKYDGKYLVVRFDAPFFNGNCQVFSTNHANINPQVIGSLKVIPIR
ncbi:MAG: hypothetical protein FJZ05_01025 [Candidatus Nealsonbacteria bacterium]|nr:hypothetical protein [Candidatus Nealsonbacteria bacterium]